MYRVERCQDTSTIQGVVHGAGQRKEMQSVVQVHHHAICTAVVRRRAVLNDAHCLLLCGLQLHVNETIVITTTIIVIIIIIAKQNDRDGLQKREPGGELKCCKCIAPFGKREKATKMQAPHNSVAFLLRFDCGRVGIFLPSFYLAVVVCAYCVAPPSSPPNATDGRCFDWCWWCWWW